MVARGLRWAGPVLVALVAVLALGPADQSPVSAAPGCAGQRPGGKMLRFTSGGIGRWAWIQVPAAAAKPQRVPLVVALHGSGGDGRFMESYSGLSATGKRYGFVLAYPSSVGKQWNIGGGPGSQPDDVGFIRDLIDKLESSGCIDATRVYATGISNGGGMVARLGCDLGDRLRAIAPVAGGYSRVPQCTSGPPLSVLEIHGTGDPIVPYSGKGPGRAGNVRGFLRGWAQRDGCRPRPVRSAPAREVVRLDWRGCAAGASVAHLKVLGGRHEWPEERSEPPERPPLSASREVWRFFSRLAR